MKRSLLALLFLLAGLPAHAVVVPGTALYYCTGAPNPNTGECAATPVPSGGDATAGDPCNTSTVKTNVAFATSAGVFQLVAPSGSAQVYICAIATVGAAASVQNLVGGTGATCATGTPTAMIGSTTPGSGLSFAANSGMTYGSGVGTISRTTTVGHGVCLTQSGTTAIAGNITYVQR